MKNYLIILPAFNEERSITSVIRNIKNIDPKADILVINDGSLDKTEEVAKELQVTVINHPYNLGYGAALQTGFIHAVRNNYDIVITMDADGQHDPNSLSNLFESIESSGADIVIGSRFLRGMYKMSLARRIGAWIFAIVARLYTGYRFTDPTSGFQLLKRQAFSYLAHADTYPLDYPDVNIIMLLHKNRFKIVEAPVHMISNIEGDSMHSGIKPLIYIIRMFLAVIIILLRKED
jgi:glycosyltransferase involved in cell wall biosynthesis